MSKRRQSKMFRDTYKAPKLTPMNHNQDRYMQAIMSDDIVLGIGSAGTGKTFLAASIAADMLEKGLVDQIIITRPTVQCGEDLGALPGTLEEKYDPWTKGVLAPIKARLGPKFDCALGSTIQTRPLQYMRGETFDNAVIIVDESQNATPEQLRMLCTRPGVNSKLLINGDILQSDLDKTDNGLSYLVKAFRRFSPEIEIVEFTIEDCVRSELCKRMIRVFEKAGY